MHMCYAGTATASHVLSPVKKVYNQIVRLTKRERRNNIKWYPPINVAELGRPRLQSRPVDLHLCLTLVGGFHLILRCASSILVITLCTAVWRWQVAVCAPATPAPRRPRVGPRTRGGSLGEGTERAGDGARRRRDGHEVGRGARRWRRNLFHASMHPFTLQLSSVRPSTASMLAYTYTAQG